MRKSVILIVIALALIFPALARAQAPVTFDQLNIQLWPEYDQPAVLVIYDFVVSAETTLPVKVDLRMPGGGQLLAVAKEENGGLVNLEHDLPKQQGNYDVISFTVSDRAQYHLEFYIPYTREGNKRNFAFTWPGDYSVTKLGISMQEPVQATNVVIDPAMSPGTAGEDGFVYHNADLGQIDLGESVSFKISYDKANDTLSSALQGVQPTSPFDQPISGQANFMSMLPWILGGMGLALIVGGGIWYWLSGRSSGGRGETRRRHASHAEDEAEAQVYCSQCGKRAQDSDRFCRACGSRLRTQE